jgi:mannitol-1-/sugar-/sorbitol-6-/2-deoxyglucose-6-phosphatase
MYGTTKAVIFDMDGVLIDSEPLWRRAMIKGFGDAGMPFTEDDCRKTTGIRFNEVVEFWVNHYKIKHLSAKELENNVMNLLLELVEKEGKTIENVYELINYCKISALKIGLATSSSNALMHAVLKKLNLSHEMDVAVSAELLSYGKPHPEVFLTCAKKLEILPSECIVVEDSVNGVISGKAAQMMVIAVPDAEYQNTNKFAIADYQCGNMKQVLELFRTTLKPAIPQQIK